MNTCLAGIPKELMMEGPCLSVWRQASTLPLLAAESGNPL